MDKSSVGYEYLDHTADVQIHSWGKNLKESFEQAALAMMGYMTEIDKVDIDPELDPLQGSVEAEDLESLLYTFLEEVLFMFSTEYIIFNQIKIIEFEAGPTYKVVFQCRGEEWDHDKHPQGTEIKAITYSAMQVIEKGNSGLSEIFVIVDI
eukprot:TRINITY_DN6574_c0_g1_i1.p1 TRINITY_DN6574_c0_g1~~TRINITY_DN6574_c0_g1_i1.p1  ORF type:complete len:151 (-),score=23.25 TRINITY_DN6574_c0_g1_i1:59-511(-)